MAFRGLAHLIRDIIHDTCHIHETLLTHVGPLDDVVENSHVLPWW